MLQGITAALLTPFKDGLKVDYGLLEKEIDYVIEDCQVDIVAIAALETQEYTVLGWEERQELIRRCAALVGGRCPIVVGISHANLERSVEMAELAGELGAAAVQMLVPLRPWGTPPNTAEMVRIFEQLVQRVQLPILAYSNPAVGVDVPVAAFVEIAKIDRVQYLKESSRDLRKIGRVITEIDGQGLAHTFTTAEMLLNTLLYGGVGATMPPPACRIGVEIYQAWQAEDVAAAVAAQRKFARFPGKWIHWGLAPVMKASMQYVGLDLGDPAPPYQAISGQEREELFQELERIGMAKARRVRAQSGAVP